MITRSKKESSGSYCSMEESAAVVGKCHSNKRKRIINFTDNCKHTKDILNNILKIPITSVCVNNIVESRIQLNSSEIICNESSLAKLTLTNSIKSGIIKKSSKVHKRKNLKNDCNEIFVKPIRDKRFSFSEATNIHKKRSAMENIEYTICHKDIIKDGSKTYTKCQLRRSGRIIEKVTLNEINCDVDEVDYNDVDVSSDDDFYKSPLRLPSVKNSHIVKDFGQINKGIKVGKKLESKVKKKMGDIYNAENIGVTKDSDSEFEGNLNPNEVESESDGCSEWEEVPVKYQNSPKRRKLQAVEIVVSKKPMSKKSKIEQAMDEIRRRINRKLIDTQYNVHKVHLLSLISVCLQMNSVGSNIFFRSFLLSIVPSKLLIRIDNKSTFDMNLLVECRDWFLKAFPLKIQPSHEGIARLKLMSDVVMRRKKHSVSELEYILMFVVLCRSLGLNTRIVYSFQPTPYKPTDTLRSRPLSTSFLKRLSSESDLVAEDPLNNKVPSSIENKKLSKMEKTKSKKDVPSSMANIKSKKSILSDSENDDKDFQDEELTDNDDFLKPDKQRKKIARHSKVQNSMKIKKLDFSNSQSIQCKKSFKKEIGLCDWFAEVYLNSTFSWITVAGPSLDLDKMSVVEKRLTKPISYILACDTDNHIKDLTRKYDSNWLKTTSKTRLDDKWWNETLSHYGDDASDQSLEEDLQIHDALLKKPFPTSIAEFKNHSLYALQRHLLKYEAIYPSCSLVLGYLKEEPIFARECVHTLCSREKWLIEGQMVLPDQEPYKYVKALPKPGKIRIDNNHMLGLYGRWQTKIYIGPLAVNGIVPKNNYGNVDLFKPWMLPHGTVHLKGTYYGMAKAARKGGIDAAPAMVGWEFHKGLNHPILDGWIVCKENVDYLLDVWKKEQELDREKERQKREQRVTGNWRRLVKHLLIRNKLRNDFQKMSLKEATKRKAKTTCQKKVKKLESDSDSCSSFETVSDTSSRISSVMTEQIKRQATKTKM